MRDPIGLPSRAMRCSTSAGSAQASRRRRGDRESGSFSGGTGGRRRPDATGTSLLERPRSTPRPRRSSTLVSSCGRSRPPPCPDHAGGIVRRWLRRPVGSNRSRALVPPRRRAGQRSRSVSARLAAEQGVTGAHVQLGHLYALGRGDSMSGSQIPASDAPRRGPVLRIGAQSLYSLHVETQGVP